MNMGTIWQNFKSTSMIKTTLLGGMSRTIYGARNSAASYNNCPHRALAYATPWENHCRRDCARRQ